MNGFLSHLTARSFDLTEGLPLVTPRLPSLFEPPREIRGVAVEGSSWSPVDNLTKGSGEALSLPTVGREPLQVRQTLGKRKDTSGSSSIHSDNGVQVHRRATESFIEAENRTSMGKRSPLTVLPNEEMRMATSIHSTAKPSELELPTKFGSVQEKHVNRTAQPLNPSEKESLVVENVIVREHVERIVDRDFSSGAAVGEQHNVISPVLVQPFQRPMEQIPAVWQNPGHCEGSVKQEPTIHVTIGRIEVRAVAPTLQKCTKPNAPAPMSLDEYLRRRMKGQDR